MTIEPNDRKYSFCKILNGNIILNKIGKIIDERWRWLFSRYDHIMMDEYIIMPDHFHGIIKILPDSQINVRAGLDPPSGESWAILKSLASASDSRAGSVPPVHFGYNHQNKLDLSHIIGAFKTTASKRIHEARYPNFKWKRSFHDRIIRQDELEIKRAYIRNNPKNWKKK